MVRSIRVTRTSFEDDGRQSARRALEHFAELLDVESRQVLIQAVELKRGGPPSDSLLNKLQQIRESLLERLIVPAVIGEERADEELLETLASLRDEIINRHSGSAQEQLADAQYRLRVEALESPAGLRRTLEQYSVVYAATCGQATKDEMARLKVESSASPEIVFDSVLVDEAARAAPFDLFIPISLAARRIILVGDQMQLPHFLDQELAEQVETADPIVAGGTDDSVTRHLKESLFQRLYERLRELEKTDGIQRVVTLDTQFRMHPDLGAFVSKCFYENQPTPTKIKSGRVTADFAHTLPGYVGACAAWLEVPAKTADDHEQRLGTSKYRKCEAQAIATDLQRLAETPEGQRMTYGIIAGYSAQVEAIKESIESNGWHLSGEELCKDSVKIAVRVGTVDAFQGREFDVVYFSMTRSNALPSGTEAERRKKYGHLLFPNRLCVALSRQKRLLVVVGNSEMIAAPEPETLEALSPLIEFRKLCGGSDD
jgi:superfamily I DNA and/or RNA helicase